MEQTQTPQAATPVNAEPEAAPAVSRPISFLEPVSQLAEGVVFVDDDSPATPPPQQSPEPTDVPSNPALAPKPIELTDREFQALHNEASAQNDKQNFLRAIQEANKPPPEPQQFAGPVPLRVAEQTKAEQAAGAALVARQAEIDGQRPPRPKDPYFQGTNTEVFRPGSFVPDQKKGQGYTQARNL